MPRDIVIQEGEMVDEFEQHLVEVGEVLAQEEKVRPCMSVMRYSAVKANMYATTW